MKIGLLVGSIVHDHRYPRVFGDIGIFPSGAGRSEQQVFQVIRRHKGDERLPYGCLLLCVAKTASLCEEKRSFKNSFNSDVFSI